MAAAFNCIQHSYFHQMLEIIGSCPKTIAWFQSYLADREQSVRVDGIESSWLRSKIGSPQGSVLGPFIFIVYINFVLNAILDKGECRVVAHADDTNLTYKVRASNFIAEIQDALLKVEGAISAFQTFGFRVNESEIKIVLFRGTRRKIQLPTFKLGKTT